MKKLELKKNLPFLILASLLTCYLVLKDSLIDIKDTLLSSNILIILLIILIIFLRELSKAKSFCLLAKKSKAKLSLKDSFLLTLETDFFNGVTPFALGGQPFQLFLLKKKNNIGYTKGLNIIFCDYYAYQIILILLVILLYILNMIFHFIELNLIMKLFLLVGFLVHFGIFLFLLYVTYNKSKDNKALKYLIHLLSKVKILKNEEETQEKIVTKVNKFKNLTKSFRLDYKLFLKVIGCNLLFLSLHSLVPYLAFLAIGVKLNFITCFICGIFIWTIASFIPIPGATGGMEYSFITMFSVIATDVFVKSAALIWRFSTYYFVICVGAWAFFVLTMGKKTKENK